MKISVNSYAALQAVVGALGSPSPLFYSQSNSAVFKVVAIISGTLSVEADLRSGTYPEASLLTDYPAAIETIGDIWVRS